MELTDRELDFVCDPTRRPTQARLYLVAKRYSGVFVPMLTLLRRAHVSVKRGRVELAELVAEGLLDKQVQGIGNSRRVRYVARAGGSVAIPREGSAPIPREGSAPIPRGGSAPIPRGDPGRSLDSYGHARASDPDLPVEVIPTRSVRPSGGGLGEGTDGRTDGEKFAKAPEALVGSIAEAWELQRTVVAHVLGRFLAELATFSPSPTERELREYLRAALLNREQKERHPAFQGIAPYERFLGITCTRDRFAQWRRSKPPLASTKVELTCNACGHVQTGIVRANVKAVACRNCDAKIQIHDDDDDAIATLIKQRAGGSEA